jgi:hypothetical protein
MKENPMKTTQREAAARMALLEYEFLAATGTLDGLAGEVRAAGAWLPGRKAGHLGVVIGRMRDELGQILIEIDEPITDLVLSAEGAPADVPTFTN